MAKHGPWGHKDADTLSNPDAAKVFPPQHPVPTTPGGKGPRRQGAR